MDILKYAYFFFITVLSQVHQLKKTELKVKMKISHSYTRGY